MSNSGMLFARWCVCALACTWMCMSLYVSVHVCAHTFCKSCLDEVLFQPQYYVIHACVYTDAYVCICMCVCVFLCVACISEAALSRASLSLQPPVEACGERAWIWLGLLHSSAHSAPSCQNTPPALTHAELDPLNWEKSIKLVIFHQ